MRGDSGLRLNRRSSSRVKAGVSAEARETLGVDDHQPSDGTPSTTSAFPGGSGSLRAVNPGLSAVVLGGSVASPGRDAR